MTLKMIKQVLSMGDNKGSALRQMLKDLNYGFDIKFKGGML